MTFMALELILYVLSSPNQTTVKTLFIPGVPVKMPQTHCERPISQRKVKQKPQITLRRTT